MHKTLFPLYALLLSIVIIISNPFTTFAQSQQNGTNNEISISVSANVVNAIELVTLQSMRLTGSEAENDVIQIDPTSSPNAGKMVAYGTPNSNFRISYLRSRELSRIQGNNNLTFTYRVAGNEVEEQSTAELLELENRDLSFNDDGEFYLWIGGSVDISAAAPGNYQGNFTLEIENI